MIRAVMSPTRLHGAARSYKQTNCITSNSLASDTMSLLHQKSGKKINIELC